MRHNVFSHNEFSIDFRRYKNKKIKKRRFIPSRRQETPGEKSSYNLNTASSSEREREKKMKLKENL